jgi:hypothetical protein
VEKLQGNGKTMSHRPETFQPEFLTV